MIALQELIVHQLAVLHKVIVQIVQLILIQVPVLVLVRIVTQAIILLPGHLAVHSVLPIIVAAIRQDVVDMEDVVMTTMTVH